MNDFGQKIKKIRKDRGLTQQEFADSLGYAHKSTINKIESGQEAMSYQKILTLLNTYMLDAKDLFEGDNVEVGMIGDLIKNAEVEKHESCIIYIHGLNGNSDEADFYSFCKNKHDVIGLNYEDGNPWEVKNTIIKRFNEISKDYKDIYVIANSIGAFYTYMYLFDLNIKEAFFISPLVNMKEIIEKTMKKNNISMEMLQEEKFIKLNDGQILSYDFYQSLDKGDSWKTKTRILYGEKDRLVKHKAIFDFVANHDCTLTVMKNGEHYFHTPGQLKYIKKWINDFLPLK